MRGPVSPQVRRIYPHGHSSYDPHRRERLVALQRPQAHPRPREPQRGEAHDPVLLPPTSNRTSGHVNKPLYPAINTRSRPGSLTTATPSSRAGCPTWMPSSKSTGNSRDRPEWKGRRSGTSWDLRPWFGWMTRTPPLRLEGGRRRPDVLSSLRGISHMRGGWQRNAYRLPVM